jgi:hypothetical protein
MVICGLVLKWLKRKFVAKLWAGFIWLGGEGGEHENEGVITGRRYI